MWGRQGQADRNPSAPARTVQALCGGSGALRSRHAVIGGAPQAGSPPACGGSPVAGLPDHQPTCQGPVPAASVTGTPESRQIGQPAMEAAAEGCHQAGQGLGHPVAAARALPFRPPPMPAPGPSAQPLRCLDGGGGKPRARSEVMGIRPRSDARSPDRREQRLWHLLWSACPGVGVVRIAQLERHFDGLAEAWSAPPEALGRRCGWSAALLTAVEAYRHSWGRDPLPHLEQHWRGGRGGLLPGDGSWPEALAELQRPPLWLHWRGRGSLWPLLARRQAIAVVGNRHPSGHGQRMAQRIGVQLASHGWPVVSGLAEASMQPPMGAVCPWEAPPSPCWERPSNGSTPAITASSRARWGARACW
jgi:DNA recombination-mediator protein A